jgi:hypothetical protein
VTIWACFHLKYLCRSGYLQNLAYMADDAEAELLALVKLERLADDLEPDGSVAQPEVPWAATVREQMHRQRNINQRRGVALPRVAAAGSAQERQWRSSEDLAEHTQREQQQPQDQQQQQQLTQQQGVQAVQLAAGRTGQSTQPTLQTVPENMVLDIAEQELLAEVEALNTDLTGQATQDGLTRRSRSQQQLQKAWQDKRPDAYAAYVARHAVPSGIECACCGTKAAMIGCLDCKVCTPSIRYVDCAIPCDYFSGGAGSQSTAL